MSCILTTACLACSACLPCLQGSDEERQDVVQAYKKHKGSMAAIVDSIMLASPADEDRFRAVIDAAIKSKEVATFAAFRKGAKRSAASKKAAAKRKAKIDKVNTNRQCDRFKNVFALYR